MVKKLLIITLGCFFVVSIRCSHDPKYNCSACQAYLEESREEVRNLKKILNSLGRKIQAVIAKKTQDKVVRDMVLIVSAFISKFENCLLNDQRKKASCMHKELAAGIAKVIAAFDLHQPDLISQLTELIGGHMKEVFDGSVHRDIVNFLHQCITNYFIPPRKEARNVMIASVAAQQQIAMPVKVPTLNVHEEKKVNVASKQKQMTPLVVSQETVGAAKGQTY